MHFLFSWGKVLNFLLEMDKPMSGHRVNEPQTKVSTGDVSYNSHACTSVVYCLSDKPINEKSVKFYIFERLENIPPPFPPKQCWFFYFFDCTDHSAYTTLNWGAGAVRELTLDAKKSRTNAIGIRCCVHHFMFPAFFTGFLLSSAE